MLSTHGCYSHEEHAKVALNAWVNVVYGKMTAVDRKKKLVVVNNGNAVPYDHLVLSTGLQYQLPMPTDADIDAGTTNSTVPNKADRRFSGVKPKNLFLVNDTYDSAVALYWIENKLAKSSSKYTVHVRFSGVKPKNLFLVNDTYDSAVALYWIENKLAKSSSKYTV